MTCRLAIEIDETTIIPWLQAEVRRFVRGSSCSSKDAWTLAIVASEAATNVQKFARRGTLVLIHEPGGIMLIAEDDGPGLVDPERALRDGISEGEDLDHPDTRRIGRRGMGTGLGAIRRLMGELSIESRPSGGTRLVARYRARFSNSRSCSCSCSESSS